MSETLNHPVDTANNVVGRVTQVRGPVVDVQFEGIFHTSLMLCMSRMAIRRSFLKFRRKLATVRSAALPWTPPMA